MPDKFKPIQPLPEDSMKLKSAEEKMYDEAKIKIIDEGYHDILTSVKFQIGYRTGAKISLKKNSINSVGLSA